MKKEYILDAEKWLTVHRPQAWIHSGLGPRKNKAVVEGERQEYWNLMNRLSDEYSPELVLKMFLHPQDRIQLFHEWKSMEPLVQQHLAGQALQLPAPLPTSVMMVEMLEVCVL